MAKVVFPLPGEPNIDILEGAMAIGNSAASFVRYFKSHIFHSRWVEDRLFGQYLTLLPLRLSLNASTGGGALQGRWRKTIQ